ncbi:MAG TPA: hypothetical protein DIU39_00680 [Flavobacteriales bacterium]|mgnify:CR=1 FL=1|nr:hypothetical protein [Flavobacteriales bacterium]|tara:strand:- start:98547 stop:99758 length:1212 start_codon:yes stop_codon:yes gene_type:complete
MRKLFSALLFLGFFQFTQAQDTISIMNYNILNFPLTSSTKADTLKYIVQYKQPDILMVTELTSLYGSNLIMSNALNVDGVNYYAAANFIDGPDTDNNLYYNSNKFGLKSQEQIATDLRDISEYVLYYKSADLGVNADTIFLYCYMVHLKASSGTTNEQKRQQEAQAMMNHISSVHPEAENIIIGGDFNFYASSEPAYYTITSGTSVTMYDPINRPGNWHNNSSFADIHTQSSRTSLLSDGGNNGGMDDRFDMFFVSGDLMSGTNRMIAIPSSYETVGQDGQRFNQSVISPANQSVPQNIATKLYYMSDHLPVYMEFALGGTIGVGEVNNNRFEIRYYNNEIFIENSSKENLTLKIFNSLGQQVFLQKTSDIDSQIPVQTLPNGMYVVYVQDENNNVSYLKFVK